MAAARAVVIGAGIGGLAAAAGLRAAGWDVTVCERAAALEPVGAGLALAPNGLRALDALGIGDAVRAHAVPQEMGIRSPGGRWLLRSSTEQTVHVPAIGLTVDFAAGEEMRTEVSAKFRRRGMQAELAAAGFAMRTWWTDSAGQFGLSLSVPV